MAEFRFVELANQDFVRRNRVFDVQTTPQSSPPPSGDFLAFRFAATPRNGIYFFYESGESWGHGGDCQRIVRVGTHREGNFRSRMADHYVVNERKMEFNKDQAPPKDRSIVRKNIGRALLHRDGDCYEALWEIDFTTRDSREAYRSGRDVKKGAANRARRDAHSPGAVYVPVDRVGRSRSTDGIERTGGVANRNARWVRRMLCIFQLAGSFFSQAEDCPKRPVAGAASARSLTEDKLAEVASLFGGARPELPDV